MTAGPVAGQLDLFARPVEDVESERDAWSARFARAEWVAPWDCSGGLRKGQSVLGWVCPGCGQVEVNEFLLNNNHGYDPQVPGRVPFGVGFGEGCTRLWLLASQERSRLAREAKAARIR